MNFHNERIKDIATTPLGMLALSAGEVEGAESGFKFGRTTSSGTAEEVIWDGGGTYEFLTAGETMTVVSDSVADTSMQTVELTENPSDGNTIVFIVDGVSVTKTFVTEATAVEDGEDPIPNEIVIGVDADTTATALATEMSGSATLAVVTLPYGTLFTSSDSTTTIVTGAGAWNLYIVGLDDEYNEVSEFVLLNGITPVTTTQKFFRVYRAYVVNAGTNSTTTDANTGEITITPSTSTTKTQAKILEHIGQTLMCVYTVPTGKTMFVTGFSFSAGRGKEALMLVKVRVCGDDCAFQTKYTLELYQSNFVGALRVPFRLPEKTDIIINIVPGSSGDRVSASFGYLLIENNK